MPLKKEKTKLLKNWRGKKPTGKAWLTGKKKDLPGEITLKTKAVSGKYESPGVQGRIDLGKTYSSRHG
jgi:hypothetical protein